MNEPIRRVNPLVTWALLVLLCALGWGLLLWAVMA